MATQLVNIRPIISAPIGADGLFIQPDTRDWTDQQKAQRELEEAHNRERFAAKFNFADNRGTGNGRTYDPNGHYRCGDCNQARDKNCLLIGKAVTISLKAGSCKGWEIKCAGDPELDFGADGVATAEEMDYGEEAEGVGFGCSPKCPYHSAAFEPDSQGRDKYCGKGNFRMDATNCCELNGAKVVAEYEGNEPMPNGDDDEESDRSSALDEVDSRLRLAGLKPSA